MGDGSKTATVEFAKIESYTSSCLETTSARRLERLEQIIYKIDTLAMPVLLML